MTFEVEGFVKYYLKNNEYYVVGNNSSNDANGITDKEYYGEIVIPGKIRNKEIREIAQDAFSWCQNIMKVTIFAKLISINRYAFSGCRNIAYINIPQTVTFIGAHALDHYDQGVPFTVEFNKGRTEKVYFDTHAISGSILLFIIYPSNIEPRYNSNTPIGGRSSDIICAHSSFEFCRFVMTTTNMSRCPAPMFESYRLLALGCPTCKRKTKINIPLISLFILIAALPLIYNKATNDDKNSE